MARNYPCNLYYPSRHFPLPTSIYHACKFYLSAPIKSHVLNQSPLFGIGIEVTDPAYRVCTKVILENFVYDVSHANQFYPEYVLHTEFDMEKLSGRKIVDFRYWIIFTRK